MIIRLGSSRTRSASVFVQEGRRSSSLFGVTRCENLRDEFDGARELPAIARFLVALA